MTDGKTTWRVGELATATGVSVRTLRHYDEVGLLSPSARVGDGPRRYTPADVQRLHHILALRGLGLALVDIAAVIDKPGMDVTDLLTRQLLHVCDRLEVGRFGGVFLPVVWLVSCRLSAMNPAGAAALVHGAVGR